jgi:hypothetical protein
LRHVDLLIGNDRETSSYTTAVVGNGSATDTNATISWQQEDTTVIGSGVFYVVRVEIL